MHHDSMTEEPSEEVVEREKEQLNVKIRMYRFYRRNYIENHEMEFVYINILILSSFLPS